MDESDRLSDAHARTRALFARIARENGEDREAIAQHGLLGMMDAAEGMVMTAGSIEAIMRTTLGPTIGPLAWTGLDREHVAVHGHPLTASCTMPDGSTFEVSLRVVDAPRGGTQ